MPGVSSEPEVVPTTSGSLHFQTPAPRKASRAVSRGSELAATRLLQQPWAASDRELPSDRGGPKNREGPSDRGRPESVDRQASVGYPEIAGPGRRARRGTRRLGSGPVGPVGLDGLVGLVAGSGASGGSGSFPAIEARGDSGRQPTGPRVFAAPRRRRRRPVPPVCSDGGASSRVAAGPPRVVSGAAGRVGPAPSASRPSRMRSRGLPAATRARRAVAASAPGPVLDPRGGDRRLRTVATGPGA